MRVALAAVILVMTACTNGLSEAPSSTEEIPQVLVTVPKVNLPSATQPEGEAPTSECAVGVGQPFQDQGTVELERVVSRGGLTVDVAMYPHPDYEGRPWSQWGQGIVAPTGNYYSAIGDHLGADGNSYIYEYNPSTNRLVLVANVLDIVEHIEGAWGYGKVHSQMVLGPCGGVFFTTYWGSRSGLSYADGYRGDLLFQIDPSKRTLSSNGLIMEERGLPTLAGSAEHGLLYTIAVEPVTDRGEFLVIDQASGKTLFSAVAGPGYRSIGVDAEGRAHFSSSPGELSIYDPQLNEVVSTVKVQGDFLRASTLGGSGTLVGVTADPETFFSIGPSGEVTEFGSAEGYSTSVAMVGDELFYLPGAHGNSQDHGAVLRAIDVTTGRTREIVTLGDVVREHFGFELGGTYSISKDPASKTLYVGVNVDPTGEGNGFGEVVLIVIGLP